VLSGLRDGGERRNMALCSPDIFSHRFTSARIPAMFPQTNISDITHVIQLAIAPVFLLTAVGTIIGVLANRLSRIVDRIRVLEERLLTRGPEELKPAQDELGLLGRRLRLIYLAVTFAVFCALFVGLLIIVAFVDAFLAINLARFVGALFILAMIAFIGGLIVFLREIFLAVASTRNTMP
jgi:MFS family permease